MTQEKSKILILSTAYLPLVGGSELAIKNITDRIRDFDFDMITARLQKDSPAEEKMGNISVFRVSGFLTLFRLVLPKTFLPLSIFLKARKLMQKNDYKFIHAFQASGAAGAAWLLKVFNPELKLLLTLQEGKQLESQGPGINFFRKLIIKKADLATAISNYLRDYILGVKRGLKVELIPNGVDLVGLSREFSYGEMTELENSLDIMPDDKVIISVSRLVWKNGIDLLIQAVGVLNNRYTGRTYKLILAGDGEEMKKLKNLANELGLSNNVIFAGSIRPEDLPKYLKIADVFVRPSRSEGLGSAFLESMAAGVPVIGTKIGGIPDFLEDRKTGLFCDPNPESIAAKINVLIENESLRHEIIKNSRALVEQKYDWNFIADKFKNLYNKFAA